MKKQPHYPIQQGDVDELEAQGFFIKRFNGTHWRITKEEHEVAVDVWPTVRKVYIVRDARGSYHYGSLYEEITRVFKRFEPKL